MNMHTTRRPAAGMWLGAADYPARFSFAEARDCVASRRSPRRLPPPAANPSRT